MTKNFWKHEFDTLRRECTNIVDNRKESYISYISCSRYGRKVLLDCLKRYQEDNQLDYELGILSDTEYERLDNIANTILDSINHAEIY